METQLDKVRFDVHVSIKVQVFPPSRGFIRSFWKSNYCGRQGIRWKVNFISIFLLYIFHCVSFNQAEGNMWGVLTENFGRTIFWLKLVPHIQIASAKKYPFKNIRILVHHHSVWNVKPYACLICILFCMVSLKLQVP